MTTIICGGKLITRRAVLEGGGLIVNDGVITGIFMHEPPYGASGERIDAGGLYISPGFIDTHVHGGGGADVMDGTVEAVLRVAEVHEQYGMTSFLPTTLTASRELIRAACKAVIDAKNVQKKGARILGIHIEGPFISERYKGAQNARHLLAPGTDNFIALTGGREVLRVSMAPELPGAFELADYLSRRGILVSVAHSDAGYEIMQMALKSGFSHVTHMFNGMSGISSPDYYCRAGVIESVLELDGYSAEIICDGCHMPPEMIRLLLKCKTPENVMLTSDATRPTNMPEGQYELGGLPVIVENGVAMLEDRSSFAGSVATADRLVRNAVKSVGLDVLTAVNMISHNVAKSIGMDGQIGSLEVGKAADVVLFDDDINIKLVMRSGMIVADSRRH